MEASNQLGVGQIITAVHEDMAGQMNTWVYITCRLMAAQGLLEYKGMSTTLGQPEYYVYSDPNTHDIYAIQRPHIGEDAEDLLMDRMVDLAMTKYMPA